MTPTQRRSDKQSLRAGGTALAACAVCCAGPVFAVLGGIGVLAFVGAVWIPPLLALAVVATAGMFWVLRHRRESACSTTSGPVEIGMPRRRPARQ